jgi:hypothetical protein
MSDTGDRQRVEHLNAVLRAIRTVNQVIAREKDPDRLLQGICDGLVETRGYRYAWIALLDPSARPTATASAGITGDFGELVRRMQGGDLPLCVRTSLEQPGAHAMRDVGKQCARDARCWQAVRAVPAAGDGS